MTPCATRVDSSPTGTRCCCFPKGKRTEHGEINTFQAGVGMMAARLGLPVVPVRIDGLDRVLHRGWRWPKRGRVSVVFGAPLTMTGDDYAAQAAQVEAAVRALLPAEAANEARGAARERGPCGVDCRTTAGCAGEGARMRRTIFVTTALVLGIAGVSAAQPPVVTFTPTVGYPTFAKRDPVLRVTPGRRSRHARSRSPVTTTRPTRPDRGQARWVRSTSKAPRPTTRSWSGSCALRPNRDTAISAVNPQGISALFADVRTRMLNDPPPARRWVWRLDRARNVGMLDLPNSASKRIEIPLAPMLGRVAVAPRGDEEFGGLWPGDFGGNMDVPDIREGATVYLPVFHEGAYFYFGDGHAAQGDGEIVGSASRRPWTSRSSST